MTDILFGQSYFLRFDPKLWEAMQPYPPLGTLYAAALMRSRGYDVALFDAMLAESEQAWAEALDRRQPRFAVIFEDNFNYLSKMCLLRMREAAFTMIAMARQRGCIVIVCGADATDHSADYLQHGADYVLLGEGEVALGELVDALAGRSVEQPERIPGVVSGARAGQRWAESNPLPTPPPPRGRGGEGGQAGAAAILPDSSFLLPPSSFARQVLRDLDSLPFPAWDLVDIPRYRQIWRERHGYYSMNLATTRGCPYHCNWCAKPIWGQRYNSRSPENVVAEMKWLAETYQPDHIWFVDDIMGLKPGWMQRFADLVQGEGLRLPFKCLSRVDLLLREGEIDALARAGAQVVWVGAESGSQKILDAMEKGTTVEQIYEAARRLHAAGVRVAFFLQFGYPGETREDVEKTLQMVRDCQPDDIGMSVSYPLPGTKFYDRVRDELGAKQNWQDSSDLAMLYEGPYTTEFYRQLHTVLHKEFRSRKTWRAVKNLSPGQNLSPGPSPQRRGEEEGSGRDVSLPGKGGVEWRQVAGMVYHAATLPLARRKLDRLERRAHSALGPLAPGMSQQAAATPSPQE